MADLSALTLNLCGVPSTTGNERALCDLMEGFCRQHFGGMLWRVGNSLVAGSLADLRPGILLVGHLDTVPPHPHAPRPQIDRDRVIGLGSSDMKGGLAVMIALSREPDLALLPVRLLLAFKGGAQYACGLRPSGTIECWGYDYLGRATPPSGVFVDFALGVYHGCARTAGGLVTCWGSNYYGQAAPPPGQFQTLAVGWEHACGIRPGGAVLCWGDNRQGQTTVPAGQFVAVAPGERFTCGLRGDGTYTCWGETPHSPPPDTRQGRKNALRHRLGPRGVSPKGRSRGWWRGPAPRQHPAIGRQG